MDDILPPDRRSAGKAGGRAGDQSAVARIIARWMDEFIRIPGTNFRIGFDAIIGLFPGVGDFLASSIGLVTLAEGVRLRLPASVLTRMGGNILINAAVGSIPGVGDVFSAWFRSNSRNLHLINRWRSGDKGSVARGSRVFAVLFFAVVVGLAVGWLVLWFLIASTLWQGVTWMFGGGS